jgi:hypothetical protein
VALDTGKSCGSMFFTTKVFLFKGMPLWHLIQASPVNTGKSCGSVLFNTDVFLFKGVPSCHLIQASRGSLLFHEDIDLECKLLSCSTAYLAGIQIWRYASVRVNTCKFTYGLYTSNVAQTPLLFQHVPLWHFVQTTHETPDQTLGPLLASMDV